MRIVPEGWTRVRLGDVSRIEIGRTPPRSRPEYWDTGKGSEHRWVSIADMRHRVIADTKERITDLAVALLSGKQVPAGTPLMSFKLTVGRVAVPVIPVFTNEAIAAFYPRQELDRRFLVHALPSVAMNVPRDRAVKGATLNTAKLNELELLLPPRREQVMIADVLDQLDIAIGKTEAVTESANRFRGALAGELLTRGVPTWHGDWKRHSRVGTFPADWSVVRLDEVAEIQTGRALANAANTGGPVRVPYVTVANVKDGHLDLSSVKTTTVSQVELERFSLRRGDVLFNEGGDADKVGRGCVWGGEIDPCLHQNHVFAVRPDQSVFRSGFLDLYARSARGRAYFLRCAKQTTNLASINSSQLKDFPVPTPTLREQDAILEIVRAVDDRLQVDRRLRLALGALKTAAADALLSGRTRVRQFDPVQV